MPPPRLPRHLRPCHPSGTAYQIRCAHRTTPVPPSTVGNESPQTTKTDSHNASKESWWSGTADRLVPWARETSSTEPQPPAPPQSQSQTQHPPTLDSNQGKKDIFEEQTSDTGSGLVRKSKESPAQRQRRILRLGLGAHLRDNEANRADSQSQRGESVRKVERILDGPLDQPTIVRKNLCLSASPTSTGHERKQQVLIRRVQQKHNPTTIAGEATTKSRNDDTTAIREQLQGLFEQVKALQAALESKMALGQSSPTTRQEMNTPTAAPSIPRNDGQQSSSIQPLLRHASTTSDPVSLRRLKTSFPKTPSGTLEYTQKAFRESAYTIGQVATELESLSSSAVAQVAWHARDCIRVLSEDAKVEGDFQLRQALGVAYKNWETLHAESKYSARAYERPGLLLQLRGRDIKATSAKIRNDVKRLKKELVEISPTTPKQPKPVISSMEEYRRQACESIEDTKKLPKSTESGSSQKRIDGERLTRSIHTQSRWMKSSDDLNITTDNHGRRSTTVKQSTRTEADTPPGSRQGSEPEPSPTTRTNLSPEPTPDTAEPSEQSLLEELFPEASSPPQPRQTKQSDRYPKLNLPDSRPIVRREVYDPTPSLKEQVVNSFRKQGEQITVLQLTNCSTELTEADFRRIIPKSKHIEGWNRDGDLYKVIPGRDPLSLERLPFYYLLFKNADAALAYQKNASRLHKLSALHQPASIFSAIPAPRGFLEDGEDITAAISSYNLLPTHHPMSLNVLMQPYNPQLRALIERGGYQPVAPSVDKQGKYIWRVLMHIEGYEPTTSDLFKIFSRDAYKHGMIVPLRNESQTSIHRLRDVINLKTSSKPIASSRPRAYGTFDQPTQSESEKVYDDPAIQSILEGTSEDNPGQTSQLIMNRVYNRWVLDFEDEDTARRWSVRWHRRVLPELSHAKGAWRDSEETRVCNTELLW